MSWRSLFLLPKLVRTARGAPRDRESAWDRYWSRVGETGREGHVLWDGESADEHAWLLAVVRRTMDAARPLVDVGCGNGRYTRALAPWFPRVIGVDVSTEAVARAARESADVHERRASFRVLDMTRPGAGAQLREELGGANVFVRGLFHTLEPERCRALVANCHALVSAGGVLVLVETDYPGGPLAYLEFLGARGSDFPEPVLRCIASGLPTPRRFGEREVAAFFPNTHWESIERGATTLHSAVMRPGHPPLRIPAHYAVLRARS